MTYIEGFVLAVPTANRDAYLNHATDAHPMFADTGMTRMVETWGHDVPHGTLTDFHRAVQATADETIVFSWFEYPDRATRDTANAQIMADPRMADMAAAMPFDGKRMIMGGFDSIVDVGSDVGSNRGGYVDAVILAVPMTNRDGYQALAATMADIFRDHGAVRVVEGWGDDVPVGEVTDFRRATLAEGDENVVFSWIEWPEKATRDAAWGKLMEDERMKPADPPLFDGKRMFWGGFTPILDK